MRQSKSCPVVSLNVRVQVWYDVYMKAGGKAKRAFGSSFFGLPCLRLCFLCPLLPEGEAGSCLSPSGTPLRIKSGALFYTITFLALTGARGRSSFGRVEQRQLAGPITRRPWVRVPPSHPTHTPIDEYLCSCALLREGVSVAERTVLS